MPELDLRNDVYRRPLQTALERLGVGPGWLCADIGAGGGDVTVALAAVVGHRGRVYAVDIDPSRRDEVAQAAAEAGEAQVVAITQAAEDLVLPEKVDLAYCRFLLMHVVDPLAVLKRMASVMRPSGWLLAQEPITSAGRVAGATMSMPSARHPDIGALLPGLVRTSASSWSTRGPRLRPVPAQACGRLPGRPDRREPGPRPRGPAPTSHRDGPKANRRLLVGGRSHRAFKAYWSKSEDNQAMTGVGRHRATNQDRLRRGGRRTR